MPNDLPFPISRQPPRPPLSGPCAVFETRASPITTAVLRHMMDVVRAELGDGCALSNAIWEFPEGSVRVRVPTT
jgi:hypothetical protein